MSTPTVSDEMDIEQALAEKTAQIEAILRECAHLRPDGQWNGDHLHVAKILVATTSRSRYSQAEAAALRALLSVIDDAVATVVERRYSDHTLEREMRDFGAAVATEAGKSGHRQIVQRFHWVLGGYR